MRPRIVDLWVDELEWRPLGPPGLYTRLLSRDEETGARTALQRAVPAEGYTAPATAHFHHTYEEILGVTGCFSFDSRRWLTEGGYVYHPPCTVHGFGSAVREETTFLSRVGRDLDFNFIEQPAHHDLYHVEGHPVSPRAAAAFDRGEVMARMKACEFLGAAVEATVLSVHPDTGEASALVKLPAGWSAPSGTLASYLEIFVLQGALNVDGDSNKPHLAYFFYPTEIERNALAASGEVLAFVSFGADIGLGKV